jgi:hypothetical protein
MADFSRAGVAVECVLGWPEGAFLSAYEANVEEQNEEAISASLVAEALIVFMEGRTEWAGTVKALLDTLTNEVASQSARQREWPKNPKALGGHLKRIAPNLRAKGIWVTRDKRSRDGCHLTITKTQQQEQGER